jgi:transcriptional regulator with XRE-family HTH domain
MRCIVALGTRIQILRKKRALGVRELARLADVPHVTLLRLEQGIRLDVTTETAKKIARALGVGVDYLIGTWEEDDDLPRQARAIR